MRDVLFWRIHESSGQLVSGILFQLARVNYRDNSHPRFLLAGLNKNRFSLQALA
jgi:hypothetical protein